jgi:hypothetical protein
MTPMARSFRSEMKRVRIERIKGELGSNLPMQRTTKGFSPQLCERVRQKISPAPDISGMNKPAIRRVFGAVA